MAGVVRSSNTQGNPLHDAETGEFTDGKGKSTAKKTKSKKGSVSSKGKFVKKEKAVLKSGISLDDLFNKLQNLNTSSDVPLLEIDDAKGWSDISDNIENLLTPKCIEHIDRLYGKKYAENGWCQKWQFAPKSAPNVTLNLFTCVMGKYRYKDNHARMVGINDFNLMAQDTKRYTKVYRGFSSTGDKRKAILNSYVTPDINNIDYYGNGCYGTNIYTSTTYDYSLSYANRDPNRVMHCLVDNDAKTIGTRQLENFRYNHQLYTSGWNSQTSQYDINFTEEGQVIKDKIEAHLIKQGIENTRASEIAKDFTKCLQDDISLQAILRGYDYQISDAGTQRNILNLKKWIIRREF